MTKTEQENQAEQRRRYEEFVRCRVCGKLLRSVGWAHLRLHGMTTSQYKEEFGIDYVLSEALRMELSEKGSHHSGGDRYEPRSREDILRAIQRHARQQPRLTSLLLVEKAPRLARQALRLFGSWAAVCRAAGLGPPRLQSWSREGIIAAIQRRASAGLGVNVATVRREDRALLCAAFSHFGSWRKAVEANGLDYSTIRKCKRRTRETVVQDLRAWVERHGPLSPKELETTDGALYAATGSVYGSLEAAAHVLGLPFCRKKQQWSKDRIVEEIRRRVAEGRSIRGADVVREDGPLHSVATGHFGSWGAAVDASGFDYAKIKWTKFRTREAVGRDLCQWVREHGPLNSSALKSTDNALHIATHKTFGCLEKAARELGLPFYRKVQRWSRDRVIEEIKRRAAEGRPLDLTSVRNDDARLRSAARNHFGSWAAAVQASGFDYSRIRRQSPTSAKM